MIVPGAIFTIRPWRGEYGDPSSPAHVLGLEISRRLCVRLDEPGALVALADGRYALTGPVLAVGPASEMRRFLRRSARRGAADADCAWFVRAEHALTTDLHDQGRPPLIVA